MNNQECCDQQLTSSQALIDQAEHEKKHNKKCRGDRRAQRQRRRLHQRQALINAGASTNLPERHQQHQLCFQNQEHHQEHENLSRDKFNSTKIHELSDQVSQSTQANTANHDGNHAIKVPMKRKRSQTPSKATSATLDKTLRQLTISQSLSKKHKIDENICQVIIQGYQQHQEQQRTEKHQCSPIKKTSDDDLPDYLKVSNRIFRQMLTSSLEDTRQQVLMQS